MDEYGKELVTGIFDKNDFFGFYYFCRNSFYPESATALERATFYKVPNSVFQKLLLENPQLSLDLAQLLSDHLSTLKAHLLEMAYASVMRKTTSTILQFADIMRDETDVPVKISRSDLASVAGISTESFIRSLSTLRKDGIIDLEGKAIKILNLQKLESIR